MAFATTANHEMLLTEVADLSEEFLHWASKQRDGLLANTEGTTLHAALRALRELGQPLEEAWPYDDQRDQRSSSYQPPDGACDTAKCRKVTGGSEVDLSVDALKSVLDAGSAVLLGTRIHRGWYFPSQGGHISMPAQGDVTLGNHAVLLVGYVDDAVGGEGYFIVRNSWGEAWADVGYGYLPYGYVETHGLVAWRITK